MTDRHSLIFYLMLAGMISSISSMIVSRHSLYDSLKEGYLKDLLASTKDKQIKNYKTVSNEP